jgi:hypothetical protein
MKPKFTVREIKWVEYEYGGTSSRVSYGFDGQECTEVNRYRKFSVLS